MCQPVRVTCDGKWRGLNEYLPTTGAVGKTNERQKNRDFRDIEIKLKFQLVF